MLKICFRALSWVFWPVLFKLCILDYIGEDRFGIVDGSISQNELRVISLDICWILVSVPYLKQFWLILFNLCILVDIWDESFGIIDRSILSNKHRDIALYYENWFWCTILTDYFITFLQTLNENIRNQGCYGIANRLILSKKTTELWPLMQIWV